jgi:hypothetical protein
MPAKPQYGPKAMDTAERSRLFRQRSACRKRTTAELILALLAEVPAKVRAAYEQNPVFGPLIASAHKVAGRVESEGP